MNDIKITGGVYAEEIKNNTKKHLHGVQLWGERNL